MPGWSQAVKAEAPSLSVVCAGGKERPSTDRVDIELFCGDKPVNISVTLFCCGLRLTGAQ